MEKVVLFGASSLGKSFYEVYKETFNIIAFCDNDKDKWGQMFNGISIISPNNLLDYKEALVIITSMYYEEIKTQLEDIEFFRFISYEFFNDTYKLMNVFSDKLYYYRNSNYNISFSNAKSILFITEDSDDLYKLQAIGNLLILKGFKVNYGNLTKDLQFQYNKNKIKFNCLDEFTNFINNLGFGLINFTNKSIKLVEDSTGFKSKIVYFYDNNNSIKECIFDNSIIHEVIDYKINKSNTSLPFTYNNFSSELIETDKSIIVNINNYIFDYNNTCNFDKISYFDNEIHCVYCGEISRKKDNIYYLEKKFLKLAEKKVHIHLYTGCEDVNYLKKLENLNKYIHWEGKLSLNSVHELSKYNIGLALININQQNVFFTNSIIPKNIYYYIAANIPILTLEEKREKDVLIKKNSNLNNFITYNGIGHKISLDEDDFCYDRINYISKLKYTNKKEFNNCEKILSFYEKVSNDKVFLLNENEKKIREITVLIPTKNRSACLKRCVTYFQTISDNNLKVKIIILDSSDNFVEKENNKKILNNDLDSEYYEFDEKDNDIIFYSKILFGLNKVKTKYVCLCADDDFLLKYSLIDSIKILDNDSNTSTVIGNTSWYKSSDFLNENLENMGKLEDISFDNMFKRLLFYVSNMQKHALFYTVYRKKDIEDIFKNVTGYKLYNPIFQEILVYFNSVVNGKVKIIRKCLNLKDCTPTIIDFVAKEFHYKIKDGTFNSIYTEFKNSFKKYLEGKGYSESKVNYLDKVIDKAFSSYLKSYFGDEKGEFIKVHNGKFDLELLLKNPKIRRRISDLDLQ
jgi:hypothetical protein